MTLVALTGATGFIGQHLARALPQRGYKIRALLRRTPTAPMQLDSAVIGDLVAPYNLSAALADVDAVIHSAAVSGSVSGEPENDFRVLNTEATIRLARAAQRAGAKRFIFMSSVRAQVGPSAAETVTETQEARPGDEYGKWKLAAERGIAELDIDWVALRPVLVYGRGVKGNVARLLELARSPYPLPFGALRARRSLLSLENLVDAVETVLRAEGPLRRPLLVADAEALTVGEMIAAMRRGMGRRPGLIPVPASVLASAIRLARRDELLERLLNPLTADTSALRGLGWRPRVTTPAGLAALSADCGTGALR